MSDPGDNPFEDFDLEAESDEADELANVNLELTEEMIAAYRDMPMVAGTQQMMELPRGLEKPGMQAQMTTRETLLRLLRVPMGQPVRVKLAVTLQGRDGERFVQAIHALMSRMRRHARKRAITLEPFKLYVEYIAKTEDGAWEEVSLQRWDKPKPALSAFDTLLVQAVDRPGVALDFDAPTDTGLALNFDNNEESEKE